MYNLYYNIIFGNKLPYTQPIYITIIIIIIYRIYTAAPRALFACVYNALFCRIRKYNNGPWRMVGGCVEVRRFKWTAIVLEGFRAFRSIYQWRLRGHSFRNSGTLNNIVPGTGAGGPIVPPLMYASNYTGPSR